MRPAKAPPGCFLGMVMVAIIGIIGVRFLLPWEAIPYVFEEFLFLKGTVWQILGVSWPIFMVGFVVNLFKMARTVNPPEVHQNISWIPFSGFVQSFIAGFFEEIGFRWVLLYGFMGLFWVINRVLIGLFNFPILQTLAATPVMTEFVNFITNWTPAIVDHPGAWTVGYAVLASNWKFQKGHMYMGLEGQLFSFGCGFIFFQLTFSHGLFAAMIIHFAFDFMVYLMLIGDIIIEKAVGHHQPQAKMFKWYP